MSGFRGKRLIAVLAAAGLLGAGAGVWAKGYGHGPRGGDAGGGDELGVMARLHDKLKLNEQQETLWKKARETSRETFKSMRGGSGQELREKMRAEIDKTDADLRSIMQLADQQREQMRAQMEAARKQTRGAWLAVYDTLDANQKEQVRLAIKQRMERGGHMGMRGGRGPMQERGPVQRKESPEAGKS